MRSFTFSVHCAGLTHRQDEVEDPAAINSTSWLCFGKVQTMFRTTAFLLLVSISAPSAHAETDQTSDCEAYLTQAHAKYLAATKNRGEAGRFPTLPGFIEIETAVSMEIKDTKVISIKTETGKIVLVADIDNPQQFTRLRYADLFHQLGSALDIVWEGPQRVFVIGKEKSFKGLSFDLSSNQREIDTSKNDMSVVPSNLSRSIGMSIQDAAAILHAITGVEIDFSKDLVWRMAGGTYEKPNWMTRLYVRDPERIARGFASEWKSDKINPETRLLVQRAFERADFSSTFFRLISSESNSKSITQEESRELQKRLHLLGVRLPVTLETSNGLEKL